MFLFQVKWSNLLSEVSVYPRDFPICITSADNLQCVWSIEMGYGEPPFSDRPSHLKALTFINVSLSFYIKSLAISSRTRSLKIMDVTSLRSRTSIRTDRPTPDRRLRRPITIPSRQEKTIHVGRMRHFRLRHDALRMD